MKSRRIVIVVLNYMNYKDTEECVESILQQDYDNYHILIVDNGSENESYSYLRRLYRENKNISVIKSRKNYGFAKGNNIGIHYARNKLEAEYVMLLNSDTILTNPFYIQYMVNGDETGVGVIGSGIKQKDGKNIKKISRYVSFPGTLVYYIKLFAEIKGFRICQQMLEKKVLQYKASYILQGCVLLLTPSYFKYYEGLDCRTFLYCEEELLFLRCQKVGLEEKIVEGLTLFHKCGMSSKNLNKNKKDIWWTSYKYVLWESLKMYLIGWDGKDEKRK